MRFGQTLRDSINPKWKSQYVDYAKLKGLLREGVDKHLKWTENDENKFCDEIFNVQLNKVADFQEKTFKGLECRAQKAAAQLQQLAPDNSQDRNQLITTQYKDIETELDDIISETKELKKYSEINYTAFLKIVKKHDRKRGNNYKIRPMLLMSLSKRPFNNDHVYSPLLSKLSILYYVVRQYLDEEVGGIETLTTSEQSQMLNGERYTAYKFWIHLENLLEVKTFILRRLPVLIYSQASSKEFDVTQTDSALNSLYFDSPDFILYNRKVDREVTTRSLRLRWYGLLDAKPMVFIEQKTIYESGLSEERRFPIKEKYIQPFIKGEYKMEKSVAKMERQEQSEAKIEEFKKTVSEVQNLILENDLQPVLRANYTRTAFQKPLDDKVRISIDTNLAFIKEDCIDPERACKNPGDWHRLDVDNTHMTYPFLNLNQNDINRFPYAILEVKVKDEGGKKHPKWVDDLMASHLVHKTPGFSKFVHGVAVLFDDYVNKLPFWLSDLEIDIRKDPQAALDEENQRRAKNAENEQVVGSLLGTSKRGAVNFRANLSSSLGKSYLQESMPADERIEHHLDISNRNTLDTPIDENLDQNRKGGYGTMSSIFPFSSTRYAQARRGVTLPPGVTKPTHLIKDSGPIQVEPKVWLANERTYVKWMQIAIQLAVLGVGLNTAGSGKRTEDQKIAKWFGFIFVAIAAFTACWGLYIQKVRRKMIVERSGKDFDNWIGPLFVGCSFLLALILNSCLKFRAVRDRYMIRSNEIFPSTPVPSGEFL